MATHINLMFNTENGANKTIRIPNAKSGLTHSVVRDAMNAFIASTAIETRNGALSAARRAVFYDITTKPFDVR